MAKRSYQWRSQVSRGTHPWQKNYCPSRKQEPNYPSYQYGKMGWNGYDTEDYD